LLARRFIMLRGACEVYNAVGEKAPPSRPHARTPTGIARATRCRARPLRGSQGRSGYSVVLGGARVLAAQVAVVNEGGFFGHRALLKPKTRRSSSVREVKARP
jgi:hypothetical protein